MRQNIPEAWASLGPPRARRSPEGSLRGVPTPQLQRRGAWVTGPCGGARGHEARASCWMLSFPVTRHIPYTAFSRLQKLRPRAGGWPIQGHTAGSSPLS